VIRQNGRRLIPFSTSMAFACSTLIIISLIPNFMPKFEEPIELLKITIFAIINHTSSPAKFPLFISMSMQSTGNGVMGFHISHCERTVYDHGTIANSKRIGCGIEHNERHLRKTVFQIYSSNNSKHMIQSQKLCHCLLSRLMHYA
jgi:hypothetical protein